MHVRLRKIALKCFYINQDGRKYHQSLSEPVVEGSAMWLQFLLQDVVWSTDPGVSCLPLPFLQKLPQVLQHVAVGRVRYQVLCFQRVCPACVHDKASSGSTYLEDRLYIWR
ncbi:hypothetical protein CHARACLAT_008198 [Characodon lateralis]|uniref:Uncharacterized protein n=1 Tax=Characodon lateralis TaxID=208331 RepID=A0ABU7ES49_9TELE|nr:hypothetical protein [Characodon lateralis]